VSCAFLCCVCHIFFICCVRHIFLPSSDFVLIQPHHDSALVLRFLHHTGYCTMHYCPNPSCRANNARQKKKAFSTVRSFSIHLQHSPECKLFVFEQSCSTTSSTASSLHLPVKRASINPTSHLFRKQRLRLNPTFTEQQASNNAKSHSIEDEVMDDDDDACLSHDNCSQNEFLSDDDSVSSQRSAGATESFSGSVFADKTRELPIESDYSCFTTSKQCVTYLCFCLTKWKVPNMSFKPSWNGPVNVL